MGCGSGQMDTDIVPKMKVSAMDISKEALVLYQYFNKNGAKLIQGDILNIPCADNSFDGVYNVGVMEHFSAEQIDIILEQFRRVLRPNGKLILFWPPRFGLSVIFLGVVHFFLNVILRKKTRLHPDEDSLIKSKKQVIKLVEDHHFSCLRYYFGPRDLFTYVVVVAVKRG